MSVKERLIEFIKFKGISKSEFCREIEVSSAFVTSIVKSIQPDKIERITLKYPELNPGWLLTGEGEMLKPPKNQFSQMTEQEIESITGETIAEELMKLLKRGEIFLATTHHKIVDEKNEEIAKLHLRLEKILRENWELQRKIDELTK